MSETTLKPQDLRLRLNAMVMTIEMQFVLMITNGTTVVGCFSRCDCGAIRSAWNVVAAIVHAAAAQLLYAHAYLFILLSCL